MPHIAASLRSAALAVGLGLGALGFADTAFAAEEVNVMNGYAVHGYDPVAYFTMGKPTEGKDAYVAEYDGAKYRFASAENRDAFVADPAKYAPQFGGFCAYGMAQGRKFDGNPANWAIEDGKLYLNVNATVQSIWNENRPGYIKGAENNWTIIETVADKDLAANPPKNITLGAQ